MNRDNVASPAYRDVLIRSHASVKGWGGGGKYWGDIVKRWAIELEAKNVLDYGCGQGALKKLVEQHFPCAEYDPGVPGKDRMPEPADLVVATDVLEHIEPALVDNVLKHIRELARKGIFLVIALSPANMILVDGRNAHLSLHPPHWWLDKLKEHKFALERWEHQKGLRVWAR